MTMPAHEILHFSVRHSHCATLMQEMKLKIWQATGMQPQRLCLFLSFGNQNRSVLCNFAANKGERTCPCTTQFPRRHTNNQGFSTHNMLSLMQRTSRGLAAHASFFIIGVAIITFFVPSLFDWVRGATQTIILGLIMLTMGLTLTTEDFHILLRRPFDIVIGALAQFFIMPGVAWLLVHVWHLEPALALGILLVGCCPGGVSSNIMSYLCRGDVAYSVGMTCTSTLLAPVMTPLLMQLTAGEIVQVDAVGMFLNILLVTIIPVSLGMLLNYLFGRRTFFPTVQSLMPGVGVVCLAMIVGGVISTVHDELVSRGLMLFLWTFAIVFCHNTTGYLLGWLTGRAVKFGTAKRRTLSIEVGMQNAGLGTVLAGNFFATQPLAVLPCAISCAWHSISGTILAGLFLRMDRRKEKE